MAGCAKCGRESAEDARFCPSCGAPLESAALERRKLATMLFCDVSGSTELGERLDAESVREIMLHYFREMSLAVERHGGTVEKFIGDAVMAVFGVPVAHEDDAARAVRAASEMREHLADLNGQLDARFGVRLALRIGVNSGEVVAGDASSGALVTGDAVNVAARLQQAAASGEILLGESTYRLARHVAEAEIIEPVEAKGKSERLSAYRLLSPVTAEMAGAQPAKAPMIGRARELQALRAAFGEAVRSRSCRLCVIVGEAGIGKSRLAAEFEGGLDGIVLRGRCLPYGEGITYWPLAEIVRQVAEVRDEHSVEEARSRISALLAGEPRGSRTALVLQQAVGLAEGTASSADIAWAARKLVESLAKKRRLVVCLDDLQWAEASFLDLIESMVARSRGVPILLLGLARPELVRERPGWPTLRLQPLTDSEAGELVVELADLDDETRSRVITRADGNPLFVEELVTAVVEEPELELPRTLDALLSARLDRLEPTERAVIERGAIEGQDFHRGAVVALSDDVSGPGVAAALQALAAAELIQPVQSSFAGDVSFRFRNILIRDAAYRGIAKKVRAELHERFADWLLRAVGERVGEYEEVLGYQLEQSYRCRSELGVVDARALLVASAAADWLASAGRHAFARGDMVAAARLLRRAARLVEADPPRRVELLPELGKACRFAGDRIGADEILREAVEQAAALGDRRLLALSRIERMFMRLYTDPEVGAEEILGLAEASLDVFGELGDDRGLAQAWALIGHANWLLCQGARMEEAFTHALECTRRANDPREQGWILRMLALVYYHGPTPAGRAIERCEEILRLGQGHGAIEISTRAKIAGLEAMQGRFEVARDLCSQCRKIGEEVGLGPVLAALPNYSGPIELLAGDLEAAERELRTGCDALQDLGETSTLSTAAALLARTLERQGRLDEAERFTVLSERTASDDDLASQTTWRGVRARVLARRGELAPAERLAYEGARVAARTDFLVWRGEALLDLAEVLRLTGDSVAASSSAEEALQLFEAKGHVVLAERTRALLREPPLELRSA